MAVKINVTGQTGVDIQTQAEKDAGRVDVGISSDIGIDVRPTVGVKINDNKIVKKGSLNFKRAINGDIMIFDHGDIDIMILKEQKKVVAFAKDMLTDNVYGAENRLFNFLRKKGLVSYDTIQGGNIYGSMEAKIMDNIDEVKKPISIAINSIYEWIQTEKPIFNSTEAHDEMMDDALLNPDDEHTTELGEVPHEEEKGSILTKNLFAPYLYGRYTY